MYKIVVKTALGPWLVTADNEKILRVELAPADIPEQLPIELPEWLTTLSDMLLRYGSGHPVDFKKVPVEEPDDDFSRQVYRQLREVGWGATTTYGTIAKLLGKPGHARQVGRLMGENKVPVIVPCHRVLSAGNGLGGFSGGHGLKTKLQLLHMEGTSPKIPVNSEALHG
jgi:methylated-DNA-[protein]-cysteine S-methyltransferase